MTRIISVLLSIFMTAMVFLSPTGMNIAVSATEISANSPYAQQYIKEKSISKNEKQESLSSSQLEEERIISELNEVYVSDLEVFNITKKYSKNKELSNKITSLTKEDKIEVMSALVEILPTIKEQSEQESIKRYLERYLLNVEEPELLAQIQEAISGAAAGSYTGTYNGNAAADWAYEYGDKRHTNYPDLAGELSDCTNFVSQAMHEGGGLPTQDTWYCYKKDTWEWYKKPLTIAQLNYSWNLADPSPWISAKNFDVFWSPKTISQVYKRSQYIENRRNIYRNHGISKGDPIIFYTTRNILGVIFTTAEHVMIVSMYDDTAEDFLLAGHTNDQKNYPLREAIQQYDQIKFTCF